MNQQAFYHTTKKIISGLENKICTRLSFFHLNALSFTSSFDFFFLIFIYLFLAALGLRCCARAFSSCCERGLLFVAVRGLLIVMASLVAEHGL